MKEKKDRIKMKDVEPYNAIQDLEPKKMYVRKPSPSRKMRKQEIQPNSLLDQIKTEMSKDQLRSKKLSKTLNPSTNVIRKGVLEKRNAKPTTPLR